MMDASEIAEQLILIRRLADATYEATPEGYSSDGRSKKVYEEELDRLIRHLKGPLPPLGSAEKPFPAEET